jgi:hypothetical protein
MAADDLNQLPFSRKRKQYSFRALMGHYPLHGQAPKNIQANKVIIALVELEDKRFAFWKDEVI